MIYIFTKTKKFSKTKNYGKSRKNYSSQPALVLEPITLYNIARNMPTKQGYAYPS